MLWSSGLRHSEIMLKFKVSKELGVKFALTWISLRAEYLFLSCSSRVADQDPLVFLFYLTLKTPAVILWYEAHEILISLGEGKGSSGN